MKFYELNSSKLNNKGRFDTHDVMYNTFKSCCRLLYLPTIYCVKEKYSRNINLLSRSCSRQLAAVLRSSQLSEADPQIDEKCPNSVKKCTVGTHRPEGAEEVGSKV